MVGGMSCMYASMCRTLAPSPPSYGVLPPHTACHMQVSVSGYFLAGLTQSSSGELLDGPAITPAAMTQYINTQVRSQPRMQHPTVG